MPCTYVGTARTVRDSNSIVCVVPWTQDDLTRYARTARISFNINTIVYPPSTSARPSSPNLLLSCLFDSCAALSTGYKPFHWFMMHKYPYIVHSYEEFNDFNPFQPIKLASAIQDPDNTKEICSQLTAVVWYHTPYCFTDDSPCIVSFALSRHYGQHHPRLVSNCSRWEKMEC